MFERAEAWHLTCELSDAQFLVQFWDTHEEFKGRRRMAFAVFQQKSMFPSVYKLCSHGHRHWPPESISCDGPESAKLLLGEFVFAGIFDHIIANEMKVVHADEIGEHFLEI